MTDTDRKLSDLVAVMKRLRGPGGCPWDREQTAESIKPFLLEETYEVLEAMDEGKPHLVREELGDLLFQIVFLSELASEEGRFAIDDVIAGIADKMVKRHPHVFGDAEAKTSADVLSQWERRKRDEKGGPAKRSALDGVPRELPALLRAQRLQDKASRVGFDWDHPEQVMEKVDEELREFREVLASKDPERMEEELGDLFFSLVNISRFIGVNPEDALRKTISKFIRRFRHIEEKAHEAGRDLGEMTLAEMDALWEEAKREAAGGN
ncbi:MAG: nucleoside triphosphate pyrophosphohydrolase [Nitrospirae bacterium RBG_16_64_22]|nr:MAG: nucleoside triphosphate pyrophosphohydrolase [Nitrospirae bacterium RBG_16_64_22]